MKQQGARFTLSFPTKRFSALLILFIFRLFAAATATGVHIGPSQPYANIQSAAGAIRPGDTVFVHAGSYPAYQFVADLHGAESQWIVITRWQSDAMDISGSWQFSKCSYLKFEGLTFKGNATNTGRLFHVENGGSCATQSHHIVVDSCSFLNVTDPTNSAFKFGGVDTFEVNNCVFKNIASGAFDFNACHAGRIKGNWIENCLTGGHIKGGATFITMERNIFLNASSASWVAFEFGGDTGAQFYCPGSTTEVSDLKFYSNIVAGGYRGLALSSAVNCEVVNNTFYECRQATMRFLTTSNLYPALSGNIVRNNIFAFGAASQYFNGGAQPAGAVSFRNNIYSSTVSPAFNGPYWDAPELDAIKDPNPVNYGSSTPMFVNGAGHDFHLVGSSPAIAAGYTVEAPTVDFYGDVYKSLRCIGAAEYNSIPAGIPAAPQNGASVSVFPNPAAEYILVTSGTSSDLRLPARTIEVFNAAGTCVLKDALSLENAGRISPLRMSLTGLPSGIYFLRIGSVSSIFVIKK